MLQQTASLFLKHKYKQLLENQRNPLASQQKAYLRLREALIKNTSLLAPEVRDADNLQDFARLAQRRSYADYRTAIDSQCAGLESPLFRDELVYVGLSSATTSPKSKAIPYNRSVMTAWERFQLSFSSVLEASTGVKMLADQRLTWGSTPIVETFQDNIPAGYVSGFISMKSPWLIRRQMFPKVSTLLLPSMDEKTKKMADELRGTDIRLLAGVPSYLVNLLESLKADWGVENLSQFFPNLQTCVYSSTSIHAWRDQIDRLIGRPLKYVGCYAATEGMFGYEIPELCGERNGLYSFHLDQFVFLFRKNDSEGKILTIGELKEGDEVELLLSSPNGLVNYAMGDLLKIKSIEPTILFEVMGRIGQGMNVAAEKVSADEIQQAVSLVSKRENISIRHFFVHPGQSASGRPNYSWTFCSDELDSSRQDSLRQAIDSAMMEVNDDYEEARRELGFIDSPNLNLLGGKEIQVYFQKKSAKGQLKMKSVFDSVDGFQSYLSEIQKEIA